MTIDAETDWWERIGHMSWQHMALIVLAVAAFVALMFASDMKCGVSINSTPNTTTTTIR
jgi:hypothetical protein